MERSETPTAYFGWGLMLVLSACATPGPNTKVFVHYQQMANFCDFATAGGASGGCSEGLYIVYRIDRIQNTKSEAVDFLFDRDKVITITKDGFGQETLTVISPQGYVDTVTVPAGQTKEPIGCIIKKALRSSPDSWPNASLVDLAYAPLKTQLVEMVRDPDDTTTAVIIGTASLNVLQQQCGLTQ